MYNLPNIITISRIVVIPVIFLTIYIQSAWWYLFAGLLFIVACITDYLDGYLARSRNELSAFGRLLDPIADKLLVVSALVIIVANRLVWDISYIPVIVILCREILVSGLREFLSEVRVGMPVTRLAKWKTGFQMTALSLILIAPAKFFNIWYREWSTLGEVCLWIAGVLTFITGYQYFEKSLNYVKSHQNTLANSDREILDVSAPAPKAAAKKASVKKTPAKKAPASKKTAVKKTPAKKVAAAKPAAK